MASSTDSLVCRLMCSSGHGARVSCVVVRTVMPRHTPCSPIARISRSTVPRATRILGAIRLNGCPQRGGVGSMLLHRAHGALADFQGGLR